MNSNQTFQSFRNIYIQILVNQAKYKFLHELVRLIYLSKSEESFPANSFVPF
jgi:hypothetical protein